MPEPSPTVTRFAPSPSGYLHLGHAYAALFAHAAAERDGGRFLLRIEDIDTGRARPEFDAAISEDLHWLGLAWADPVLRQSERFAIYRDVLRILEAQGLIYPCFCTRKEIAAEVAASGQAPHGPAGLIYPGTCRTLSCEHRQARIEAGADYALRLDVKAAMAAIGGGEVTWADAAHGRFALDLSGIGDVVLARKDVPTSYHLAVVVDDAATGVTLVTRGEDLLPLTHVQVLLCAVLGYPVPAYHHHRLLTGADGKRFAKRDKSLTIRALREAGYTPDQVRDMAFGRAPIPEGPEA